MKILAISQQWAPEDGTPQRRFSQLTRGLTSRGHEVRVIAAPPHYPGGVLTSADPRHAPGAIAEGDNGETVYRSHFREHSRSLTSRIEDQGIVAISSWWIARKLVKSWRPDVIISTAPPLPQVVVTALIGKRFRVPYVVDLRDVWPDILTYMNEWGNQAEANPQNRIKATAYDALIASGGRVFNWALHGATAIVTTTPSFAEKLRSEGFQRVLNVRNMASVRDDKLPTLADMDYLDGTNREPGTLRVLYAGTTGRAQGLESALEAVRLTKEAGVNIQMRVVGSGSHLRLLMLQAERDHLPVEFTGRMPFSEVLEEYAWSDTTLVHLRNWEPLNYTVPSKLYEALSVSRHVTVAANGESARIITESGAGDAVPAMDPQALADLWTRLANDRQQLNVANSGRNWLLARETPDENTEKFARFLSTLPSRSDRFRWDLLH